MRRILALLAIAAALTGVAGAAGTDAQPAVTVPDLRGLLLADGLQQLAEEGLCLGGVVIVADSAESDRIVAQDPPPGAKVARLTPTVLDIQAPDAWMFDATTGAGCERPSGLFQPRP